MKKILVLITILIITLSMTTAYAFSGSFIDMDGDTGEEAVNLLSSYGIFNGYPDKTFKPDNTVTRAEMAKIATIAAGYYEYTKNMTSVYEDMHDHWAESYVELANVLNIVKGISADKYGPDNKIKFDEAITIIIRLLGYTDESLVGQWPSNYYEKAKELNVFENIVNHSEYATRRDISIMLYNALRCDLVKVKENNNIYKTGKKLLSLIGTTETKLIKLDDLKINDGFNYSNYLFNKWDVYYNLNGSAVYMTNPRFNEFSGKVTGLLANRVIFVTDVSGNVRAFQLPDIPIVFNGALGNFNSLDKSDIKVVYEDDSYNGKVIGVIAYKNTDKVLIDKSDLYKSNSKTFAGKYLPTIGSQVNYNKIHIYGAVSHIEDIKINDVVYFYETDEADSKKSIISIEVFRSQVQGIVSNVDINNKNIYYTVNNKVYKTESNYIFTENANVNDTVKFILDKNNDIVKLYITSYGKYPSTYGIIMNSTSGTNSLPTAKILDRYGNVKTYNLAGNSNVVTYVDYGTYEKYISTLKRNDIVKFDPVYQGPVKIINYIPTIYISNYYNEASQTIANTYKISSDTFIVYEGAGKYQIINPNQLDNYLVGMAYVNSAGHVDALYLTKGVKTNNEIGKTPTVIQSFTGTIYDVISSYKKADASTSQIEFYNKSGVFYVSNTSAAGKKVASVLNTYVKAVIVNGVITSLERVTPETDKIKISAIYSDQLQIDGITYMEYSSNVKVYICTLNSLGNISSFKIGSKSDIVAGSKAQLYDINGLFDGIIDVVILFK